MMLTSHSTPFLGPPGDFSELGNARAVVVPFGFEGGVSYGRGAAFAPEAVLEASRQLEFYDEELETEPYRMGIATIKTPEISQNPQQMLSLINDLTGHILDLEKFPIVIGGDHSITSGCLKAVSRRYPHFGVIQLDAHADLRDSYEDNPFSHACAMARALEITPDTLQIGIRSMSLEEAQRVKRQSLPLCTMRQWRQGRFDLQTALAKLPEQVFYHL